MGAAGHHQQLAVHPVAPQRLGEGDVLAAEGLRRPDGDQNVGLANLVTMEGDSDGTAANGNKPEANNDACVPVLPGQSF